MCSPAHSQPKLTASSPLDWLQVTSFYQPGFARTLAETIGPAGQAALFDVLPYSVVVANLGTEPIVGMDVRFRIGNGARTVTRNFFYHTFSNPNAHLLVPGAKILLTPFKEANAIAAKSSSVSMAAKGGGAGGGPNDRLAQWRPDSGIMQLLSSADTIQASVDLAFASDGRFAGPDLAMTIPKLTDERDAYVWLRRELLLRLARGDSDESILTWLDSLAAEPLVRDSKTKMTSRFVAARIGLSEDWRNQIRHGRKAQLWDQLTAQTPETVYSFVYSIRGGLK